MERDEPIGLLIGDVRRRIRQAVSSRGRRYHLTTQQFWVLVAIYEHPGFSLGELATHLQVDDPTRRASSDQEPPPTTSKNVSPRSMQ